MDTSETFIKMCEKATEIQPNIDENYRRRFNYGDYYASTAPNEEVHLSDKYGSRTVADGYYIWLPRQDQLQEMIDSNFWTTLNYFLKYVNNLQYPLGLTSMEQLWLAFVMKEKYNKIWNGEDWVKIP